MLAAMLAWLSIAPLGRPVVPPVYCCTATSVLGSTLTGVGLSPRAMRSSNQTTLPAILERLHVRQLLALGDGVEHLLDGRQRVGEMRDDHRPDVPAVRQRLGLLEQRRDVEGDDDVGARVRDDVLELVDGIERVAVDHRRAGPQHGVVGDDVERRVGQHQRDARAALQPELLLQRAGEGLDLAAELAERRFLAEEVERHLLGVLRADHQHLLVHRRRVERHVPGDVGRIVIHPGPQVGGLVRRERGHLSSSQGDSARLWRDYLRLLP